MSNIDLDMRKTYLVGPDKIPGQLHFELFSSKEYAQFV